jgi:hypothetical protein
VLKRAVHTLRLVRPALHFSLTHSLSGVYAEARGARHFKLRRPGKLTGFRGLNGTSRLLVTYLDRDMDFVWTLKHLDKTSWQRGSVGSNQASTTKLRLYK